MKQTLKNAFDVESNCGRRGDTVLNYVWIDRNLKSQKHSLCTLPLNYLDKAIANAQRYPESKVLIWIDRKRLNPATQFFLASYLFLSNSSNIDLCDLQEIPAFKDRIFNKRSKIPMWDKVDYARLLAVQHSFDVTDARRAFYADFDVDDAKLNCLATEIILKKWGVVVARTEEVSIENSYFGFTRNAEKFLKKSLIPSVRAQICRIRNSGYEKFEQKIGWWCRLKGIHDYENDVTVYNVKDRGYKIPRNIAHDSLDIYKP